MKRPDVYALTDLDVIEIAAMLAVLVERHPGVVSTRRRLLLLAEFTEYSERIRRYRDKEKVEKVVP